MKLKQFLVAQEVYNIGLDYARWKEKNISNRNHYFTTYSKLKWCLASHKIISTSLKAPLMRLLPHQFQRKKYELSWTNLPHSYFGVLVSTMDTTWCRGKRGKDGKPSAGKDWSFSQQLISTVLRDSSFFRPALSNFSRSESPLMRRELTFVPNMWNTYVLTALIAEKDFYFYI